MKPRGFDQWESKPFAMSSRFLVLSGVYFRHLRDEFWLARDMNTGQTWRDFTQEREAWAEHQNRALERHGHTARVSHLSYEAQGVDREPSQHLGPVAADMERNDLRQQQEAERKALAFDQQTNREQLEKGIEQNREKRERLDWMKTPSLEKKEALERPWQRATIRATEKRPWTRQASNDRERKPPTPPKKER